MDTANENVVNKQHHAGLWIGPLDAGLEWSRQQIGRVMPILSISNLDEVNTSWPPLEPTHVFLSSTLRDSEIVETHRTTAGQFPNAQQFVILGRDWESYRRSNPTIDIACLGRRSENAPAPNPNAAFESLAENEAIMHWYNANQLLTQIETPNSNHFIKELELFPSKLRPIIRRAKTGAVLTDNPNSLALRSNDLIAVITQGENRRQLWQDLLESNQMPCITAEKAESIPNGRFTSILIDAPALKLESLANGPATIETTVHETGRRFKSCRKVILDGFPRPEEWRQWSDLGFVCLPSPISNSSILHWLTTNYPNSTGQPETKHEIVDA